MEGARYIRTPFICTSSAAEVNRYFAKADWEGRSHVKPVPHLRYGCKTGYGRFGNSNARQGRPV
jgi:hypothetical protein